jgi:hypothetical protein
MSAALSAVGGTQVDPVLRTHPKVDTRHMQCHQANRT